MRRYIRAAVLVFAVFDPGGAEALAQAPSPLVFTTSISQSPTGAPVVEPSTVVEERALALWSGQDSDFGAALTVSSGRWTIRSATSMATLPFDGRDRPTFQQFDVTRAIVSGSSGWIAAVGGVRQRWDGTTVFAGRVLAGADVGAGRLQGSFVVERTASSSIRHDAADLVTTVGWSRTVARRLSVGVEGIGQDLEGFWNSAEADGGAKLLVGPSIHVQSSDHRWTANLTAGPVVQTLSTAVPPPSGGRRFGLFASATWVPPLRH